MQPLQPPQSFLTLPPMAALNSALPLRIQPAQERADPIRHGHWSQSLSELQVTQRVYAFQGDLFKLAQSVFLQAFGGYGVEALRVFLTVFLQDIGLGNPSVGVAIATCYLKWQNTPVTLQNQHQFLTDLYNTCEIIIRTPKNKLLPDLALQYRRQARDSLTSPLDFSQLFYMLSCSPQVVGVLLAQWVEDGRWTDVDQWAERLATQYGSGPDPLVPTLLTLYRQEDQPDRKFQWLILVLHCSGYDRARVQAAKLPSVSNPVNVDSLWQELFPSQLALPDYVATMDSLWRQLFPSNEGRNLEALLQRLSLNNAMEHDD